MANENPKHLHHAAQLLDHTSLRATGQNYIAADSTTALGAYFDMIASMRSGPRQRRRTRESRT
jgi:hypothetical protein